MTAEPRQPPPPGHCWCPGPNAIAPGGSCDRCGYADPRPGLAPAPPVREHQADDADPWAGMDAAPGPRPRLAIVRDDEDQDDADPAPAPPAFPVDALTGPLAAFVRWGIADGLHPEAVGAAGLAALSTLTGPARLALTSTRTVRGIVWIALVGKASSGKSPAFEHAFATIRQDYRARMDEWQAAAREYAERSKDADTPEARAALGPRPAEPEPYEVEDATMESVPRWLNARRRPENGDPSGAVVCDELTTFLDGLNQYKGGRGADLSKWLTLWTGTDLSIKRVKDGGEVNGVSIYIPAPVVSIAGSLVPENVRLLGKQGSGFRPRWLPFYAPPVPPALNDAGAYPPAWTDAVMALATLRHDREWSLTGRARTEWERARQRWHKRQSGPEPDDVIEALRKADAQALRIALVLAESLRPGAGGEIPPAAMRAAVALVDYVMDVWASLPGNSVLGVSRRDDVYDAAIIRMTEWLRDRPAGTEGLPEGAPARPRATRRELARWLHEPASRLAELISEYRQRYPGCVREGHRAEGARGPLPVFIYAPPTLSARNTETVAATVFEGSHTDPEGDSTTGHGPAETVADPRQFFPRQFPRDSFDPPVTTDRSDPA